MSKRGRKPLPGPVLALRGSPRAKDEKRRKELRPPSARPSCPRGLPDDARRIWTDVVNHLHAVGIVAKLDRYVLGRYAYYLALWFRAKEVIEEQGQTCQVYFQGDETPDYKLRPEVALIVKLDVMLSRIESKFGMTASDRVGLKPAASKPEEPEGKSRYFEPRKA